MPRGVYDRNPKEIPIMASAEITPPVKLFPVKLTKNYVPCGTYEIVGYLKEAVKRKDAAGNWKIIEPDMSRQLSPDQIRREPGYLDTVESIWQNLKDYVE